MIASELKAANKFSLSYFIQEQLELHNWTHAILADKMKISAGDLHALLDNSITVSEQIAWKLGEDFQTSPQYWFNINKG
jgi:plasmid maintenance system antidote protein VapI